jgi:hypothetical protein
VPSRLELGVGFSPTTSRELELSDACSEAQLYASGFSFVHLAKLLIDGYATVERRRINVGGREKSVPWLQITDAGRKDRPSRI